MNIEKIILKNWLSYKGEQAIVLEAKPYAVVAQRDGNPDSSNMAGKTALLEAIGFALWGKHRKRTEDEWITNGEDAGGVTLHLSGGVVITRDRKRGSSTQVSVNFLRDAEPVHMVGKPAEQYIVEFVGFAEDDWFATCAMEQKQMARFVVAKPEERMGMVEGWFELEKLDLAAGLARLRKTAAQAEVDRWTRNIVHVEEVADHTEHYKARIAEAAKAHELNLIATMSVREFEAARDRHAQTSQRLIDVRASEAILDAESLAGLREDIAIGQAHILKLSSETGGLRQRRLPLLPIASGEFDGACPVIRIACPASQEINGKRDEAKAELEVLIKEIRDLEASQALTAKDLRDDEAALKAHEAALRAVETAMRDNAEAKKTLAQASTSFPQDRGALPSTPVSETLAIWQAAQRELILHEQARAAVVQAKAAQEAAKLGLAEARATLALAAAAEAVLGRTGAQRMIAEKALAAIEGDANAMLQDGGIPLSVSMRWGREGKGLATACDVCGQAYPTSAKVKACQQCGATRGLQGVPKLEVDLSDRSGAAEDMAGIAMQLSAAAWLRRRRGAAWATAIVDEPFGACDPSNRRAMGRQLAALLSGSHGFEQAFVVAHSSETLDAMPGRILVEWEAGRSKVRVVA